MYSASVTRGNPALLVLLLDQSRSMGEVVATPAGAVSKAESLALAANSFIGEIVDRCRREEGIRDYFRIAAIGYSGDSVRPLLSDDYTPATPSALDAHPREVRGYLQERRLANGNTVVGRYFQRIWITPRAEGKTPMTAAMENAAQIVGEWCGAAEHAHGYPPVVINITDGEASGTGAGELAALAARIRGARTEDGQALLLNIHVASAENDRAVLFPRSFDELPSAAKARLLYELSSPMPREYNAQIALLRGERHTGDSVFRGMSYNAPLTELIAMMNIGSASVQLIE